MRDCHYHATYGTGDDFMTPDDFLDELCAVQPAYDWFLTKHGRIRATRAGHTRKRVFDPITAVAFSRTGEFFQEGSWSLAAAAIGMSLEDCADFVSACNFDWYPSTRQGSLRIEVLTAVRITAQTAKELSTLHLFPHRKRSAGTL